MSLTAFKHAPLPCTCRSNPATPYPRTHATICRTVQERDGIRFDRALRENKSWGGIDCVGIVVIHP